MGQKTKHYFKTVKMWNENKIRNFAPLMITDFYHWCET